MIVIVCGDRNWTNWDPIRQRMAQFPTGTTVIEGEARGADSIAREIGLQLGFNVVRMPADWNTHHRAAGPIRNKAMLQRLLESPDPDKRVIAFHSNIAESKGTRNMVETARKAGVPVEVLTGAELDQTDSNSQGG